MTRDDKAVVFATFLTLIPAAAWLSAGAWLYGLERPYTRSLLRFAKQTPGNDALLGSLAGGIAGGLVLAVTLIGRYDSHFGGAGFRRFLRGTRIVNHHVLKQTAQESGTRQVVVADTPIPSELENLHLLLAGATGTGKTVA